jgi:hypothetical protein
MDKVTAGNFQLASCQATLFTPDEEVSAAKLLKRLAPTWIDHFDGEPTTLPLQELVPREVPKLILESKSKAWRCEIASERINVFWRRLKAADEEPTLESFFKTALRFLTEYIDLQAARIGRVAAVLNRYADHPAPGPYLAAHFCQERWISGPAKTAQSFELHIRTNYDLADKFPINAWIRSKTGRVADEKRTIVLVEQDLNTSAEAVAEAKYTMDEIATFFEAAAVDFDKTLKTYYPG